MGTGWHCDICNSFKVQVEGSKKWTFIHGKYSKLMRPTMKAGKTAAAGADISVRTEVEPYIERQETILNKGDFLFNPGRRAKRLKKERVGQQRSEQRAQNDRRVFFARSERSSCAHSRKTRSSPHWPLSPPCFPPQTSRDPPLTLASLVRLLLAQRSE